MATRGRVLWLWLLTLAAWLSHSGALEVFIDYSFPLPQELGVETPSSVNCCPYVIMPDNNSAGNMIPPTFIGIGAQKTGKGLTHALLCTRLSLGTTTLSAQLNRHPQLYHSVKKELHFLDDVGERSYEAYLASWPWNRRIIRSTNASAARPPNGHLFEISPSYLYIPIAACKAKIISPDVKIVVLLRDPTERAHSGLTYTRRMWPQASLLSEDPTEKNFWEVMHRSVLELLDSPHCDFHSGRGSYSYNDCVGCLVQNASARASCGGYRIGTTRETGEFYCHPLGRDALLRGMYASQLAWWFTFLHASQFKIVNSADYFRDPLSVLKAISDFLGVSRYSATMFRGAERHANGGHYFKEDRNVVVATKRFLREFYRRPNLELYRLLHETGHHGFAPFEKELRNLTTLDCREPAVVTSGICGIDVNTHFKSEYEDTPALLGITLGRRQAIWWGKQRHGYDYADC